MSQLWALVSEAGAVEIRVSEGHPADHGHADDCEGKAVFQLEREPSGLLGETVDFKTGQIVLDHKTLLVRLREERDAKLDASDKLMLPDRVFSEELKQEIISYREALRNITKTDILNLEWPVDPTSSKDDKAAAET